MMGALLEQSDGERGPAAAGSVCFGIVEDEATIEVIGVEIEDQACCVQERFLIDDDANTKALEHPIELGCLVVDTQVIGETTAAPALNSDTEARFFRQRLLCEEAADLLRCALAEFNSGGH